MFKTFAENLEQKQLLMRLTRKTYVQQGRWTPLRLKKCEVERCLTMHTCVCLDVLSKEWCQMKEG
jgi:hypothetical protein